MKIQDAVDFVMRYRTKKVFADWSPAEVAITIQQAMERNGFAYAVESGRMVGVCVAEPRPETQTLYITHLLAITKGAVPQLLRSYWLRFAGWQMSARRRNRVVQYDTPRLLRKLEQLSITPPKWMGVVTGYGHGFCHN